MHFPLVEKQMLLALKGVGELVIARLEGLGFASLAQLVDEDPAHITKQISVLMGSTCWHNSPQARKAIASVIALAQQAQADQSRAQSAIDTAGRAAP